MKKIILRTTLILTVLVMAVGCQKDEIMPVPSDQNKLEQVTFRASEFTLEELQAIHDAMLETINDLLAEGVFNNNNANGLIPQLRNLQRAIDRGDVVEGNRILDENINPHLEGLNEGGKFEGYEESFEELTDIGEGNINAGKVTDPDGNPYRWEIMDDGKKWLMSNLMYAVPESWIFPGKDPKYGRLYTWDAANAACQALGDGWHLPTGSYFTYGEWDALGDAYGYWNGYGFSNDDAYEALIEGGYTGFDALLGGFRDPSETFSGFGNFGGYWSGTQYGTQGAWNYHFNISTAKLHRASNLSKVWALSCRCVYE